MVTDPLLEAPNPVVAIVFVGGDDDGDNELDPTETWVYTADYAVTQDDIDAGEVINQATVEGTAPNGDIATDLSDPVSIEENNPTITEICQDPIVVNESIAIIKTGVYNDLNGDECADVDETITYTFTCLLYTSPSPRDLSTSRMPSSA